MENMTLGTFIKNARLAKGYTRRDLSNLSGVCLRQICNIETGKSMPRVSTLQKICSALRIDLNDTLKKFDYIKVEDSSEEPISLGDFIKSARLAKGYSQLNLSILCEVSQLQISNIETGKSIPRISTLQKICSALGIDLNETLKELVYIKVESSSEEPISLGDFIKSARLAKGYSQLNLSILCEVSQLQISNIETGKSIPRISTLQKICSALDIDYDKAVILRAKSL